MLHVVLQHVAGCKRSGAAQRSVIVVKVGDHVVAHKVQQRVRHQVEAAQRLQRQARERGAMQLAA